MEHQAGSDVEALTIAGCDPSIAAIIVADIKGGWGDAVSYCGPCFCDYQARAIEDAISNRNCEALTLEQAGISPQLAEALASAIKARKAQ